MEGCMTCEHYEFGCCDDGLTQASGPDKEARLNSSHLEDSHTFFAFLGLWL